MNLRTKSPRTPLTQAEIERGLYPQRGQPGPSQPCGAALVRADLHWARLSDADLGSADLRWANLRWADLNGADLSDADLKYADLERAHLQGATLPDGSAWTLSSDLARFTDPTHSGFWMAREWPSAAFRMKHLPEQAVAR